MIRDPRFRKIFREAAIDFDRGEVPEAGSLPSSFKKSLSIRDLTLFASIVWEAQLSIIEDGFDTMNEVELPYLGSFRFRKGWPIYTNIRKLILSERNLTEKELRDLPEIERLDILAELEERAHEAFKERIIQRINDNNENRVKILAQSLKKDV